MGMYTEMFICSKLKEDTPNEVINVLDYMFNFEEGKECPKGLEHDFFRTSRWSVIGKCCSYYHVPFITRHFKIDDLSKSYYLLSRSDIKNYDNEIELFFDWIMPYLDKQDGEFIGYSRYEEDLEPKLYYKR